MKNRSKDRFEGIVEQFIKNDLIAREEYSYYLYGLKHLEILSLTTGGVLLIGILLKEILFTVVFLITFSLLRIGWKGIHAKTKLRCFCYSLLIFLSGIYVKDQAVHRMNLNLLEAVACTGVLVVILFFTALRRYRISRESSGWKRCIWILGVVGLAVASGIFARNETVVCGIGYACFTMVLLQFIDVVRTRE